MKSSVLVGREAININSGSKIKVLGVGDLAASNGAGAVLRTFALGSCVAVVVLYPATQTGGMVHVALPHSSVSLDKARERPGYFADTGIPALLQLLAAMGCKKCDTGRGGMMIKLVGGAKVLDPKNLFDIGKRNILAVKKVLWSFGLGPIAEDVGGNFSRTVTVFVDSGRVNISSPGKEDWQI